VARYALDASVVLARLLHENYSLVNEFWASLTAADEVFGAQLLLPECTAVIRENVSTGRLTTQDADGAVADLVSLPIVTCTDLKQFPLAVGLAERFKKFKAYDMQYLATATVTQSELVTIDGGLRQTAIEFGHPVRFLR
jgi:predicted nucleic acid-binding protein